MNARPRRSTPRQVALEVFGVLIGIGVSLCLMAGAIALQARDTRASIDTASTAFNSEQTGQLADDLAAVRSNVAALSNYSKSPGWVLLQYAPRVGTPVRQATAVMNAANQVSAASAEFDVLLAEAESGQGGQLAPVQTLASLSGAAKSLELALASLTDAVAELDPEAFPSSIQPRLSSLVAQANSLLPRVQRLAGALPALTKLLGADGPQRWFVAFQNGGESRGTGGLLGSFAIVDLVNGRVVPREVAANDRLTAQGDSRSLPEDTRQLWGPERLQQVYGVNLSPNYPYAGTLISSLWRNQTGETPDAVLAMDQAVTVALVEAVGGLTVKGVRVTGDNAMFWLTLGVYQKYPNTAAKDAFVTSMIEQLMARLASGKVSQAALAKALLPAVLENRLLLWAEDEVEQAKLAPSAIGGEVPDGPGPFAMAVVNNNAGNKMDAFLHAKVNYQGGECVAGGRRARVQVELFNDPPAKLPPYVGSRTDRKEQLGLSSAGDGSNRVRVSVYLPPAAFLAPTTAPYIQLGTERNHSVVVYDVVLAKGQRKSINVDFTMFGSPELVNQSPVVPAQPMLNPQVISVEKGADC